MGFSNQSAFAAHLPAPDMQATSLSPQSHTPRQTKSQKSKSDGEQKDHSTRQKKSFLSSISCRSSPDS